MCINRKIHMCIFDILVHTYTLVQLKNQKPKLRPPPITLTISLYICAYMYTCTMYIDRKNQRITTRPPPLTFMMYMHGKNDQYTHSLYNCAYMYTCTLYIDGKNQRITTRPPPLTPKLPRVTVFRECQERGGRGQQESTS